MVNGAPPCAVVIPEICHPPNTCLLTPLFHPKTRWPGPIGASITYVNTARWRMSKLDGPYSRPRLRPSATPPGCPGGTDQEELLSKDLPYVYEACRKIPWRPWYLP